MMKSKKGVDNHEVKRLLEINGNKRNSGSVFDRLNISPDINLD